MNEKRLHLIVGISNMRMEFPDLYAGNEAIRYLFRANHVYILFCGLLNVVAGLYLSASESRWRRMLQRTGSWLLLASAPVFLAAFVVEPMQASPLRPLTVTAAFFALVSVGLHFLATAVRSRSDKNR
ncbi:MAG: hypothetical protein WEB37_12520 [Bacteroidota bacterium]